MRSTDKSASSSHHLGASGSAYLRSSKERPPSAECQSGKAPPFRLPPVATTTTVSASGPRTIAPGSGELEHTIGLVYLPCAGSRRSAAAEDGGGSAPERAADGCCVGEGADEDAREGLVLLVGRPYRAHEERAASKCCAMQSRSCLHTYSQSALVGLRSVYHAGIDGSVLVS